MNTAVAEIAGQHLNLTTLDTQNNGRDFTEQSVWCIKAALEAAFNAGMQVEHDRQFNRSK